MLILSNNFYIFLLYYCTTLQLLPVLPLLSCFNTGLNFIFKGASNASRYTFPIFRI